MSEEAPQDMSVLENAWNRFATYDHNANLVRRKFFRLRVSMLVVGLAATVLAIVYGRYLSTSDGLAASQRPPFDDWRFFVWLLVISLPILGSVLAAGASKFARGVDWNSLRGAAEGIKREIYRYRCKVGPYGPGGSEAASRDEQLADSVAQVTARLMDTEVLNASLTPYRGQQLPPKNAMPAADDGMADLTPAQYLDWRLGDQLTYFRRKSGSLDGYHRRFQWSVAILGGAGTLLAALGQEIWVPVSVGLATALVSYLELRNVEVNLAGFNRAALELENVATRWSGLTEDAKADPASFANLVDRTETILGSENASWVQEMQKAMATLAEEETKPDE